MTLKNLGILILTTSIFTGCSLLPTKQVEIVSKPLEIDIIRPELRRPLQRTPPKWFVVSEARIVNPCIKRLQDDGSMNRPKECIQEDRENPDWPQGYTYLDRFLDTMKEQNKGDIVFVATSVGDYKVMSTNMQELRRYIRELGEVVVYYEDVTKKIEEETK